MTDLSDYQPIEAPKAAIYGESEKALRINIITGRGNRKPVWFPKSQIVMLGNVAWVKSWCIEAKSREVGGIVTINRDIAMKGL